VANSVLDGCRVLLTRPVDQAAPWRAAFAHEGAVVVDYPTIVVGPPPSWGPIDSALGHLSTYDWLIFTSATAVRFFADRMSVQRAVIEGEGAKARPQIAAVGNETAQALVARGFHVALVPDDQRQEGLVAALAGLSPGTQVLFPRALGGRDHLVTALAHAGIKVDLVPASQTKPIDALPPLPAFDVATFASPSAFTAFVDRFGPGPLATAPVVVVGETTAAAARNRGVPVTVAQAPQVQAVIDAVMAVVAARLAESAHNS
jgi:uroporphyrinogen III methyltransferase / synthase